MFFILFCVCVCVFIFSVTSMKVIKPCKKHLYRKKKCSLEITGKAVNQRDGKGMKVRCKLFFSREKIHKQFKARIFKGVVNVYLPENVLKLTLFCPSSQPSVGSLEVIKSQQFCIGLSS